MTFNTLSKDGSVTENYEGAKAWKLDPELALYTRVCTSILQDQFYSGSTDELNRIRSLLTKVDHKLVAQLAIYAREQMYLRSIPLVLAVELAKIHSGDDLLRRMAYRIIQRADEITEILAYYVMANSRKIKNIKMVNGKEKFLHSISKQLAHGVADAFHKFDEYQLKKYAKENKEIKLKDAMFLVHPTPLNKAEEELFAKIANGELDRAATWEGASSDVGQEVKEIAKLEGIDGVEKEALKNAKMKEMWESEIDISGKGEVGYMALLKNLMNLIKYNVSTEHIIKVAKRLADPNQVKKSKQLPFRFLTAYRMLRGDTKDSIIHIRNGCWEGIRYRTSVFDLPMDTHQKEVENPKAGILLEALEDAVKTACENIPSFGYESTVLIASDVSGSMQEAISVKKNERGKVIAESLLQNYDIGLMLSMMLQSKCKLVTAGMFGDSFGIYNFPKDQILRNANEMHQFEGQVGYSTNGYLVIDYAIKASIEGILYDKIFIFSDEQLWNNRGDLNHINKSWRNYKGINPKAQLYIFDLAGYGTSPIDLKQGDIFMIAGWSDKVFDVIKAIDEGEDALKKIKSIEI